MKFSAKSRVLLFFMAIMSTSYAHVVEAPSCDDDIYGGIEISFSHPYPPSPMQKLKALAMRLWGELYAVANDDHAYDNFMNEQGMFIEHLLDLSTACDNSIAHLQYAQQHNPERITHYAQDMEYVLDIVEKLRAQYQELFLETGCHSHCFCATYIFNRAIKKMEQLLTP